MAKRLSMEARRLSEGRLKIYNIRVRNYEANLREVCLPLCDVVSPVAARFVNGEIFDIDPAGRRVLIRAVEGVRVPTL